MATNTTIDELNTQIDLYNYIDDDTKSIRDNILDIENTLGSITKKINSVGKVLGTTLSIGSFTAISKALWDMDKSTTQIAVRMGKGKEGATEFKKAITDMQVGLGASVQEASKLVQGLAQKNYVGNIKEAATAAYLFSDATGLSSNETIDLVDNLSKVAKFSEKATASMFAGITKVQQANGISEKGMNALANHIMTATTNMKAFGKSDETIKSMAVSSAKLVSSFEKVGISAQTALGWVERLTDPERIEENIGLYAQLGISMTDALSGADISGQLESGMKEFGQKLKSMGPIAGAQYAKAFGVSYKEAIKAADAKSATVDATTPEEKAFKELEKAAKETRNITSQIQHGLNSISGLAYKLGPVLMAVIAGLSALIKRGASKASSVITDTIEKGVTKGVEKSKATFNSLKADIGSMFDASSYKKATEEVEKIIKESGVRMSDHNYVADALLKPFEIASVKIDSFFNPLRAKEENMNKINRAFFNNVQTDYVNAYNENRTRIEELTKLENEGNLSVKEKARVQKAIEKLIAANVTYETKMTANSKKQVSSANRLMEKAKEQQRAQLEKLAKQKEELKNAKDLVDAAKEAGVESRALQQNYDDIANAIKETTAEYEKQVKLFDRAKTQADKPATGVDDSGAKSNWFTRKLSKAATTTDKNGAVNIPTTTGGTIKGLAINGLKGLGKSIAGLAKTALKALGPMMLIALVMKHIQGPLEKIQNLINDKVTKFMDKLNPTFNTLFQLLEPLIECIFPLLDLLDPLIFVVNKIIRLISYGLAYVLMPITKVLGTLVSAIGHLIRALPGSTMNEMGQKMIESGQKIGNTGETMLQSLKENKDYMKENTDAVNSNTASEKSKLTANTGEMARIGTSQVSSTMSSDSGTASDNVSSVSSNTVNLVLKKTQKEKEDESNMYENIKNTANYLQQILQKLEKNVGTPELSVGDAENAIYKSKGN